MELTFNGVEIHNAEYVVQKRNQRDTAEKNINTYTHPYKNGFELWNISFTKKSISVSWVINKDNRIDIENSIKKLKKLVALKKFADLVVYENNESRVYQAILQKAGFDRSDVNEVCSFTLDFLTQPLSKSQTYTEISWTWSWTTIKEIEYLGDETTKVYSSITLTGSSNLVKIYNPETNQQIEMYWGFVSWDVIEIDGESMSVKLNWSEIDYLWYFPELIVGTQNLQLYSTNGFNYYLRFYNLYL